MARLLAAATLAATAGAFLAPAPVSTPVVARAENSEAFPFLKRPEKLDGSMIGDVGFDPLRLAEVQVDLTYARGAEVKHGRIAMLAVVGYAAEEYLLGTPVAVHSSGFFEPFWAHFFHV